MGQVNTACRRHDISPYTDTGLDPHQNRNFWLPAVGINPSPDRSDMSDAATGARNSPTVRSHASAVEWRLMFVTGLATLALVASLVCAASASAAQDTVAAAYDAGLDVGLLQAQDRPVALAHINPVSRDESCRRSGRIYPCGHEAWQVWQLKTKDTSILCRIESRSGNRDRGICTTPDGTDLGLWLIEYGFAKAEHGAPGDYRAAHAAASNARKGIFSNP